MPQPRNPLTYLIIGTVLGGILGAVVGIAIGSTAGRSAGGPVRVQTVISTRTVRVAGLAPQVSPPLASTTATGTTATGTTATGTTATDTTATDTTATDTTATDTTATDTTANSTDTTTIARDPNDVPPPDPNNPPSGFCTMHVCAPDFARGNGYVVQCADGVWTRQGGESGACRGDGGLA